MDTINDSTPDTRAHIARVNELLLSASYELQRRGSVHDASKLEEPEKSAFDRLKALSLSGMAYGSEEYRACLRKEKPAIAHHYAHNSHHPEHVKLFKCAVCKSVLKEDETWLPNINDNPPRICSKCCPMSPIYECEALPYVGLEGMSLLDVIEMIIDWKAASERMANGGDIFRSIELNRERFNISPQMERILINTAIEAGWIAAQPSGEKEAT